MQRARPGKNELSDKLEKALESVASGKEKLVKYSDFAEYKKHVKKVLEEE